MFSATEKALIHTRLPQWAVAENLGAEESYIHEINRKFSPTEGPLGRGMGLEVD